MTCKDCIHYGVCWKQQEILSDREWEEDQECCEEAPLFMRFPCKVGDILYYPWIYDGTSGIAMLEVASFGVYWKGELLVFMEDPESDMEMPKQFHLEDLGETVFLTREEAEEALRKEREK